jgi:hypothetical protein
MQVTVDLIAQANLETSAFFYVLPLRAFQP